MDKCGRGPSFSSLRQWPVISESRLSKHIQPAISGSHAPWSPTATYGHPQPPPSADNFDEAGGHVTAHGLKYWYDTAQYRCCSSLVRSIIVDLSYMMYEDL